MTKATIETDILSHLNFEPLAKNNWEKFVRLFGNKGACGNCWCMSFRLKKADFEEGKVGGGNKTAMQTLVNANKPTGLLAIYEGEAIACVHLRRGKIS